MSSPIKIACIGEVMIELIARKGGHAVLGVAGDTYNTAVYLQKIQKTEAYDITYITALGTDIFSQRIVAEIERHGLRADHIEYRDGQMPGLYAIDTDPDGERSFSYWRGQSAARSLFLAPCTITLDLLHSFDVIYISGITMAILIPETRTPLIAALKAFRNQGGRLVFDSNYRPRLWEDEATAREITMAMWAITDIALPSLDDEMVLFKEKTEQDVAQRLMKAGVSCGALKRGAQGPLALGGEVLATFPTVTHIVDTTAAGDSFNAGFLSSYIIDGKLSDALQHGHLLASKVIQSSGAIVDLD